ncbi:MAG: aspartate aminotransferase family protein [Campylobacter sputorum]|uniref:aspartate aminotransferase family protein n=1 Tax=Campylobacter sputorum TaxID=206 RepID=UPI000B779C25|nr:aspartate aminotransferase family protein [Campylobacter sputorum]ASM38872.1 N-succinyldiaminopimelate-aminotransferase / acetylornithine transaminase [Campylobacter sputorum bv. paraureolyticus LMG 11764]MDY6121111.1 aspartate aminotransferase family protein [Campylobacter sputorum]
MNLMNLFNRANISFVCGKGAKLYDDKYNQYIDFGSGIGVCSLGHSHKKLISTIQNQAKNIIHSSNLYHIKTQEKLAKLISDTLGYKTYAFFCNSGCEANECAIKYVRKYGYVKFKKHKFEILTLSNSFHGRTLATLKANGQDKFHPDCFSPYPEGFKFFDSIDEIIKNISENTVGVMIELVQGEGGIKALDKSEVQRLAKVLKEKNLLLITDEVQCGVYRTGEFVTSKHYGIKPDVITFAKGLAGGVPIGACVVREDIFELGDHGSTFGGNFLATSAGLCVLKELNKLKKSSKLDHTISEFNDGLSIFVSKYPKIFKEKTGLGLMLGLKVNDGIDFSKIYDLCIKNKLLILKSGKDTLRFLPPLNISKKEIKEGFKRFKKALDEYEI